MLPNYFAKLETDDRAGKKSTRIGVSQLDAALRTSHASSLATVFAKFSLGLYRRGLPLGSALTLNASTRIHATRALGVFGLSTHYIPVHVPARARGVVVAVPFGHGPAPSVAMIVGGPKGRRVPQRRRAEADRPRGDERPPRGRRLPARRRRGRATRPPARLDRPLGATRKAVVAPGPSGALE
jgi:hypothetical protein